MAHYDRPATSEKIGEMLHANPVVVRRTMAGLRDAGYVRSEKGHGGGWSLARDLSEITMLDIYTALGDPTIFAIGVSSDHPGCLVEKAVNRAMDEAFQSAQAILIARLGEITLADLAQEFEAGYDEKIWANANRDSLNETISAPNELG
jgi:DNA-binding IscR family transcriptional regulator